MKQNSKAWAWTFFVFFALFLGGLYVRDMFILISSLILLFVLSSFLLTNDPDRSAGKNRSTAAFCSVFIPGAAQLYLGQYRAGALFLTGYLLALGDILLLTAYRSGPDQILVIASFIAILVGMYFLSLVDTEYSCNKLKMPYKGDPYELKIKKYPLAYAASILVPFILVLMVFIGTTASGIETDAGLSLLIIGSWTAALIIFVSNSRKR